MSLTDKRALVTGGGVRVGRAIALALARSGCDVCIHYGRSADGARQTQADVEGLGRRAVLIAADLTSADAVSALVPQVVAEMGSLDILVNSAAIFLDGTLSETTLAMWEQQFAINLRAPYFLCQAFAAQLPEAQRGHIVNITDARINRPERDHSAYRLTKSALADMTRNLAMDLAPRIQVNALALGAILPPPGKPASHLERIAQERVPLARSGSAEIVAEHVIQLLESDFVTGAVLPLDGGEFL
ncbi:MAG: NAD(P)-dependent dehydrogenase (short-subunit alcohol dehydrogenase family) [Kiritimatiellia bacterium]|jgi:NAD(P)-dependent dehydrogenase (short-subunit alcohol dehydrogenase family)